MSDERTIELYNTSFENCVSQTGFLPRFYDLFIASSPAIRDKFKHTDLKRQVRILKRSLYTLTMASVGTHEAEREILRLRETHGPCGLGIEPFMYDLWLDCLLQAVREFDNAWTPDVERSWRATLEPHIARLEGRS